MVSRSRCGGSKHQHHHIKPSSESSTIVKPNLFTHLAEKTLFYDIENRVAAYLGAVFMLCLFVDLIPVPRIPYVLDKCNAFNQYFVKFAWGWNLLLLMPFVWLTAFVYCCGKKKRIFRHHLARVAIATFFWKFFTTLFLVIRAVTSRYLNSPLDISGHCFILIYGSLVLVEEARVMKNWTRVEKYLKVAKYMPKQQMAELAYNYKTYTPVIRVLFIGIALLQVLWDVMLVVSLLYFHSMNEKYVAAAVAVGIWYFTYRCWYAEPCLLPRLPGDDIVQMNVAQKTVPASVSSVRSTRSSRSSRSSSSCDSDRYSTGDDDDDDYFGPDPPISEETEIKAWYY